MRLDNQKVFRARDRRTKYFEHCRLIIHTCSISLGTKLQLGYS